MRWCPAVETQQKGRMIEVKAVIDILRGIVIGIANIIPGVSGGTMMVSMGIYDNVISAVTHIFKDFKKSVLTLLPYAIGMGAGIIGLSFLITYLFEQFPLQTALLFIGLIIGGVPLIYGKMKNDTKQLSAVHMILFALFFLMVILLQIFGSKSTGNVVLEPGVMMFFILLVIGVIASATMVIPGVSGSMVLMLLGFYNPVLSEITAFITALVHLDLEGLIRGIAILFPFGAGVLCGIFFVAKLIEWLLSKYESYTYSGILGLVIASPVVILLQIGVGTVNVFSVLTGVIALAAGCAAAYFLGRE